MRLLKVFTMADCQLSSRKANQEAASLLLPDWTVEARGGAQAGRWS